MRSIILSNRDTKETSLIGSVSRDPWWDWESFVYYVTMRIEKPFCFTCNKPLWVSALNPTVLKCPYCKVIYDLYSVLQDLSHDST